VRVAFVVFDGLTALDFVGFYDPVTRLKTMGFRPDVSWDVCALSRSVADASGLRMEATRVNADLGEYDLLFVPGGFATRTLQQNRAFIDWLQSAEECGLKTSVCTGALLLAAAGFLAGRRATTHHLALGELAAYGVNVVPERIVDEGDVVTAAGVTSALDLGLYICARIAGPEVRDAIAAQMEFRAPVVLSA
jgi:cyclohexyl-isocyanide hydratase